MRIFPHILILIVVFCLCLTNCGGDREGERRLREADAVMNSAPDSALSILTSMETDGCVLTLLNAVSGDEGRVSGCETSATRGQIKVNSGVAHGKDMKIPDV